ncbi:CMP-N-acetylneuraminate-beta-galactosamide-alpha-2,3-sialyltransferase 4-like isoform X4 [Scyliorhinus canicula]|uniref:CMP-N-acetylneuraminate-beta-galactosamide- alpha-2,3-sialyltransferase 4-like isoform X4 n=1 Tax=Scyliorhinus canicula TaxID=7830 RepID=UPI0018F408DD|nr:CMP-N-acetylneuraminate-beta-galactosamide-alpha-2,3-sialyltransferase 4-like isoform X4 [Scyliorhinus canicula]
MKPDCSKIFQLLLVLTIVIVMVILSTHLTLKANFHYSVEDKPSCQVGYSNTYSKQIISNFTRNTDLFLNLNKIWWRQNEPAFDDLPYGLKGSEQSIIRILARIQYDMPESINRLACKKCVIIGNGYTLRNSSLGETINEYDIVIRINDAPVRGYEKDVGSKTTLRFFYPESATKEPNIENNPGTLLVFLPFKQVDVQWLREILYNEKRFRKGFWKPPPLIWEANPSNIRILNPYYIHQAATKLLKIPLKVPPKSKKNSEHNVTHEQLFLKKLVDVGAIKYLTVLM